MAAAPLRPRRTTQGAHMPNSFAHIELNTDDVT